MQHIGIEVGDFLRPRKSGMARYTQCLVDALLEQTRPTEIYGWAPWRRLLGGIINPTDIRLRFFGKVAPRDKPDIFHATACVFPKWKSNIEIATVHDLYGIAEANRMTERSWNRVAYIQRADRIICVSHFTRRHVHELLQVPPNRTVAIPLAVAPNFIPASQDDRRLFRAKHRLPSEFYLFVGRDRYNKNLHRLVTAYARSGVTIPLCIAGRHTAESRERLRRRAQRYKCQGVIRWLGQIPDADLPLLLSCASALCMPSTFEGFGLPIIEAMACGTPVLTSAGLATEETAGGHAVLIEPKSVDSIADGLGRVLEMTEAGRVQALRHATRRTWKDVADETWSVYADSWSGSLAEKTTSVGMHHV